ncbi:MAG: LytTR family DNA-binding domain-containing protein [Pseudomonadota bacterium]
MKITELSDKAVAEIRRAEANAPGRRLRPPPLQPWVPIVLFFAVVPALIGMLLGTNRTGVGYYFPWPVAVLFWSVATLAVWLLLYLGTVIAAWLLRPWRPPLLVVLLCGAIIGSLPSRYLMYYGVEALAGLLVDGREPQPVPTMSLSWSFLVYYVKAWSGAFLLWCSVGFFFHQWLGYPRFGRPAGGEDAAARVPARANEAGATEPDEVAAAIGSGLLERLPASLGTNVIALKAEDHYVRVYTDLGSTLVLYRLSDAIQDLSSQNGVRVHRSYWVRPDAVESAVKNGRGFTLTLANGVEIPVSQTYRELARDAGLAPDN